MSDMESIFWAVCIAAFAATGLFVLVAAILNESSCLADHVHTSNTASPCECEEAKCYYKKWNRMWDITFLWFFAFILVMMGMALFMYPEKVNEVGAAFSFILALTISMAFCTWPKAAAIYLVPTGVATLLHMVGATQVLPHLIFGCLCLCVATEAFAVINFFYYFVKGTKRCRRCRAENGGDMMCVPAAEPTQDHEERGL